MQYIKIKDNQISAVIMLNEEIVEPHLIDSLKKPKNPTEPVKPVKPKYDEGLLYIKSPSAVDMMEILKQEKDRDNYESAIKIFNRDKIKYQEEIEAYPVLLKKWETTKDMIEKANRKLIAEYEAKVENKEKRILKGWIEAPNFNGQIGDDIKDFDAKNGYARK